MCKLSLASLPVRLAKFIKAPANEKTLFREMFSRRANEETFAEEASCFWTNSETHLLPGKQILLPQQIFSGAAKGETFALVRNIVASFAGALKFVFVA